MRTTYMDTVKSARENRKWYVIDATDLVLGRMVSCNCYCFKR